MKKWLVVIALITAMGLMALQQHGCDGWQVNPGDFEDSF